MEGTFDFLMAHSYMVVVSLKILTGSNRYFLHTISTCLLSQRYTYAKICYGITAIQNKQPGDMIARRDLGAHSSPISLSPKLGMRGSLRPDLCAFQSSPVREFRKGSIPDDLRTLRNQATRYCCNLPNVRDNQLACMVRGTTTNNLWAIPAQCL